MANTVFNYIIINNGDDGVVEKIKEIFQPKTESDNPFETTSTVQLVNALFDNIWPNGGSDYDRYWVENRCGAKWFNGCVSDYGDDGTITIHIDSAWDPIMGWVEKLAEVLSDIKPDVWIQNKFEDEGFNFAGVHLAARGYSSDEYIDMEDWNVDKFLEGGEEYHSYCDKLSNMMDEEVDVYFEHLKNMENE